MSKSIKPVIYVFSVVFLIIAAIYLGVSVYFNHRFFPGTMVNGVDVSRMTVEEVEDLIATDVSDYTLTLKLKEDKEETIDGGQMDFSYVSDGAIQDLLDQQNSFLWMSACFDTSEYTLTAQTTYSEEMLKKAVEGLDCMDEANVTKAKDAEIQETADGYEIVPEEDGTELDEEKVYEVVKDAVDAGETEVDLNVSDCYKTAAVTSKNTKLRKKVKKLNDYFNEVITYNIGDNQVTLDYSTIREWMTMDDDLNVEFNWNMIADWMSDLSEKYHTFGTEMEFTTSLGETITVKHETYGWLIDQATEVDALLELLNNAESAERTPTYLESARAWDEDGNDIGDTYVEIDYTNQRMWFYKDGELLVDTPIVTGNSSKKYDSPEGIFCVFNKEEEAVLKGEDYKTPVDFWMPFYEGVGIHDSKWRSEYGGTIYKTSGSHGCINTPWEQAKIIYENISIGDPVICYKGATNQKKGTTTIPQPEETRVLDKDGNDITDQSESDKTEDDDDKEDDDDTPTVDIN